MDWDQAKEKYQNVEIPEQLDKIVNQAIQESREAVQMKTTEFETQQIDEKNGVIKMKKKKLHKKIWVTIGSLAASVAFVFVVGVNVSVAFAQSVSNIPVLGHIAQIVMMTHIQEELETSKTSVKIPSVTGLTDAEFAQKVNDEIKKKVKQHVEEMQKEADIFINARIETGTPVEEAGKVNIIGDYDVYYQGEDKVSFAVHVFSDVGANSWNEVYLYNLDILNNKELALVDLFQPGSSYVDIISEEIHRQIQERMQKDSNMMYFVEEEDDQLGMGFEKITPNQTFYFNEQGDLVIFFAKYEIAPGYMGTQSFVIPKNIIANILK